MSEHSEEKKVLVEVSGEAWHDFYSVMDSLNDQISAWAVKHDLPPVIMVAAAWGLASTVDHFADLCDCNACRATVSAFVSEVMERVKDAESKIGQAVH
jgi:hypothetical protein